MSGFEVAGVVLGAIPLVISALEHYRSGKGTASSFVKWRGHLDTLIFRLKLQQTFFYLDILELLRVANVDQLEDRMDLTEEECIVILSDAKTGKGVRNFLGPLYNTFIEILARYETCLKTIAGKLGHIRRLPDTPKDDLRAILRANPPVAGRFAFKERLSFTLERGSLKVLLEELQEDRLSLKIIIKGLKTQQEHATREPSRDAIKMVRRLTQVQALAASLFSALSRYSACTCRTKHSAMAKLESRIPTQGTWQKRGQRLEPTVFDIVLPLEDFVFQQASVNVMVTDENMSLACNSSIESPQLPTLSFRPGAQYNGLVFPLPNQPYNTSEIKDLCRRARDAWENGDLLHLELVADMLQVALARDRSPSPLARITTHIPLEDFLVHGWEYDEARLTPRQQTRFAFDIASSMLQFQRTSWFSSAWNSKTIKFLVANNRSNKSTTAIVGVFVEQELQVSVHQQQSAGVPGPDPQTALLELAILLLEIWHHIPLGVWASRAQTEVQTPDHRKIAATRWLQSTSERLPPHYLTAIEQCLAICSGRLRYWEDREFQRYYCENILKPLLESCQAWIG